MNSDSLGLTTFVGNFARTLLQKSENGGYPIRCPIPVVSTI